jgi:hypothetical protein
MAIKFMIIDGQADFRSLLTHHLTTHWPDALISEFDTSCFSGEYVTGDITDDYLHELERRRNDIAKQKHESRRQGYVAGDEVHGRPGAVVGM